MQTYFTKKEELLINWFMKHPKVLVALSGGVDSCLVAFMARKTLGHENAIAVVGVSPSLKQKDLNQSRNFCAEYDIKLTEVNPSEMDDPNYSSNPVNRCFFCKSALYDAMQNLKKDFFSDYYILNGNNKTDFGDYRPGLKAASDFSALSPLAECGFEKEDIRDLAYKYGLSVWDKPASPCLSSRFPYGENITVDKLKMVENAENILNDYGFTDVRVRYSNNTARLEVPYDKISMLSERFHEIEPKLFEFGFSNCEIDHEGLVSGKLNRGLNI